MNVEFQDVARFEFREAAHYYDLCETGLGLEFTVEVERTISRIEKNPDVFPIFHKGARRALTRRFPYAVIFRIESNRILILAVMHCHRRPETSKNRV